MYAIVGEESYVVVVNFLATKQVLIEPPTSHLSFEECVSHNFLGWSLSPISTSKQRFQRLKRECGEGEAKMNTQLGGFCNSFSCWVLITIPYAFLSLHILSNLSKIFPSIPAIVSLVKTMQRDSFFLFFTS